MAAHYLEYDLKAEDYDLICPILNDIFVDPVKAEDGRTYESSAIQSWFQSCLQRGRPIVSPSTREAMGTSLEKEISAATAAERLRQTIQRALKHSEGARVSSIRDLREVFQLLDPLGDFFEKTLDGWYQPPELVVIGQESSGKSTLLERLAMMPIFPRNRRLSTRLPIRIRLRNAEKCEPITLEVYNTKTKKTEEEAYVIPAAFGAVDIREKMDEIIEKEHGKNARGVSTERIIILTIKSPYVPSINLVDTPGLVAAPESLKQSTRELVENLIENGMHNMYLATVPAANAPNPSLTMDIIQSKKLQGKTIGVFTKCDHAMALPDERENFLEKLLQPSQNCEAVSLDPYGWVCTMNASLPAANEQSSFARLRQQAVAEESFIRKDLQQVLTTGGTGCEALIHKITHLYMKCLKLSWGPGLIAWLNESIEEEEYQMTCLGLPSFDQEGEDHAKCARELAAKYAHSRIEYATPELIKRMCNETLAELKKKLIQITGETLTDVEISKLPAKWKVQKDAFEVACKEGVDLWGTFWRSNVRMVLEAGPLSPEAFDIDQFPLFIDAVIASLEEAVVAQKVELVQILKDLGNQFYGRMSPWVKVTTTFGDKEAKMKLACDHMSLVDNVMYCFLEQSTCCLLDELKTKLVHIANSIFDNSWVEKVAAERRQMQEKISRLKDVKSQVITLLGFKSAEALFIDTVKAGLLQLQFPGDGLQANCQNILVSPDAVALNREGHLFVADRRDDTIRVFSSEGPDSMYIKTIGAGKLSMPNAIAFDDEDSLFVSNTGGLYCVQMFDKEGNYVRDIGKRHISCACGVAVDAQGHVYIPCLFSVVKVFTRQGVLVRNIGTQRKREIAIAPGQLAGAHGIALDDEGNIFVCDAKAKTVSMFNKQGKFVRTIGQGRLNYPCDVAVCSSGLVYVVSRDAQEVVVFDQTGTHIASMPSPEASNICLVKRKSCQKVT
jgi:sugar lactone lactonase YvrE